MIPVMWKRLRSWCSPAITGLALWCLAPDVYG